MLEAHQSLTVEQTRRLVAQGFRAAGLDSPELDARVLVGHALGFDHTALAVQSDRIVTAEERKSIAALAVRRLAHEPVARIVGCKEFWGLALRLNAETLVPRPETETVVEAALATFARNHDGALRIADLGTGSGALLLALLSEFPEASGVGTDLSFAALDCARDNAVSLGLDARAAFVNCDYASALMPPFDLVVANPPYIAHAGIAALAPEVSRFDPPRALDGGPDGLDGYRAIAADLPRLLSPRGRLVLELGAGQHAAVAELCASAGLASGPVKHDGSGVARALVVRLLP
jgi:release factor glutamine methyltransferase